MTPRALAVLDAALARLDFRLLPLRDFDRAEAEAPGLLDEFDWLHMERCRALNEQEVENERPQRAA